MCVWVGVGVGGWVLVEKIPIYPSLEEIEHDRPNMFFFFWFSYSFGSKDTY